MNSKSIINILHESANLVKLDLDSKALRSADSIYREYLQEEVDEFIRDLSEIGMSNNLVYLKKEISFDKFEMFIENFDSPVILFIKSGENKVTPALIHSNDRRDMSVMKIYEDSTESIDYYSIDESEFLHDKNGKLIFVSVFAYESVVGSAAPDSDEEHEELSPVTRLFRLLKADKKDLLYVYIYGVLIGVASLILPLGIQAAIELISGGVFFSSIYFLIAIVIIGVMGSGVLQVLQITIVEYLQRKVFAKAAFEFAFRVPRIKMEAILNIHFPELMNRFFDVLTIQKGMPKLLIDLSTGAIQIFFGLILLSLYHPYFIFFGVALVAILYLIFYSTGPKGLKSSIIESKYKYKAVYWLEEMARSLFSFKLSGSTRLPIRKTDYFVNNYLKNRRNHFRILITQYSYVLLFKAAVTAGLLIIGTILVVQREITLGQFVASEVIIILILNSVEKIISYMDVVYDMLTAVDKISHVTDLPLERSGGIDVPVDRNDGTGFKIVTKELSYSYPGNHKPAISNIDLEINSNERICISGIGSSGKTTFTNTIAGLFADYKGLITYNNYSLRDLDRTHLRDLIGKNVSSEDIFEGTILENILVGKPLVTEEDAIKSIQNVGLEDEINKLHEGLNTPVTSGGKGFSETFIQKLILARCLAKTPKLLILNDFFNNFPKNERLKLIQLVTDDKAPWTLLVVSNDPLVMAACERVLYMENGQIVVDGPFEDVIKNTEVIKNIY